ncbi:MAG: hypothetical protein R3B93_15310 [Bacteroidia bacterium]
MEDIKIWAYFIMLITFIMSISIMGIYHDRNISGLEIWHFIFAIPFLSPILFSKYLIHHSNNISTESLLTNRRSIREVQLSGKWVVVTNLKQLLE